MTPYVKIVWMDTMIGSSWTDLLLLRYTTLGSLSVMTRAKC